MIFGVNLGLLSCSVPVTPPGPWFTVMSRLITAPACPLHMVRTYRSGERQHSSIRRTATHSARPQDSALSYCNSFTNMAAPSGSGITTAQKVGRMAKWWFRVRDMPEVRDVVLGGVAQQCMVCRSRPAVQQCLCGWCACEPAMQLLRSQFCLCSASASTTEVE
jgi:hypothetical protein